MKTIFSALFIAVLVVAALLAMPLAADACSYGSGFGYSSFSSYYSAPAAAYFQILPPAQAQIAAQQQTTTTTTTTFTPPATPAVSYQYTPPLSTIVQYALPQYAPVQPYYSNYGFSNFGHGYGNNFNRGFNNHHHHGNNNVNNNHHHHASSNNGRNVASINTRFGSVSVRR